jgi:hypothetical protein
MVGWNPSPLTMPEQTHSPLADRWIVEAAAEPSTDLTVLEVVDRCRTGPSVNEAGLLRSLVALADAIVARAGAISGSGSVQRAPE